MMKNRNNKKTYHENSEDELLTLFKDSMVEEDQV